MSATLPQRDDWGRPPDWRWHAAAEDARPGHPDDAAVRAARRWRHMLERCQCPGDRQRLAERMPVVAAAYELYAGPHPEARCLFEARNLAAEPADAVARKSDLPPAAVACYEALSFDVRARLDAADFILERVIGPRIRRDGWRSPAAWLYFGYLGGPAVLDDLTGAAVAGRSRPPAGQARAFWESELWAASSRLPALAARAAPDDPRLLRALFEARAASENPGVGDPRLARLEDGIKAMLEGIRWTVGPKGGEHLPPALQELDRGAMELRDDELHYLGSGGAPSPEMLANKDRPFPPPRRPRWPLGEEDRLD